LHRPGLSRNERLLKTARPLRAAVAVFPLVPMRTGLWPRKFKKASSLKESQMPKLKTKSGAKKRFKITGTGKVVYAQRGKRHGMIKRTPKQIRDLRGTSVLFKTDGDKVKKFFLPNG
jgi:large subunit ribosomal protein L35